MDYKNKQLMEKIMFESSFRYHAKKRKISELKFGYKRVMRHFGCAKFEEVKI